LTSLGQLPFPSGSYPKLHEELVIDHLCQYHTMVGWVSFAKYTFYGKPIYWDPKNFAPLAPIEEEISALMESTIEEFA